MDYEFHLKNYSKITTLANGDVSENISSLTIKNFEEVKQSNGLISNIYYIYMYIKKLIKNLTCLIRSSETEGYLMSEFVISSTNLCKLFGAITDKSHKLEIVIVNGTGERDKFTQR